MMNEISPNLDCDIMSSKLTEEIIRAWEEKIRKSITKTANKSSLVLIDHLPNILFNLSKVLLSGGERLRKNETIELNKKHGIQRATQTDFSLIEVMTEYAILREVIIDLVCSKFPDNARAIAIIHMFIDECVQTTVLEFAGIQTQIIKRQAEDLQAEKLMREKFIAALTHDMRTPISAAKLSLQMVLRRAEPDSSVQKHVSKSVLYLNRLDNMIQDFLDMNLIKNGISAPVTYKRFNLNELIVETINDLIPIYGERFKLTAETSVDVFLSETALRRIIENLCNNAVKYGAADSLITIHLYLSENFINISIHNEGDPIDNETLTHIFELFRRSQGAWINKAKGWGIGLPLVKALTEAQNGKIQIISNRESGTNFIISFPNPIS